MKLLLVDNDSDTLLELRALCDTLDYDVVTVHCGALQDHRAADYDLVVLSGGYWYDDELQHLENYTDELTLLQETTTPVVGICVGMQLMHVAYSGMVPLLDEPQSGSKQITITQAGQKVLGLPEHIIVHKNHTRGVISALEHFDVLGHSESHLEIMRHKTKPLIGVQFHPEIGDLAHGTKLMKQLINAVTEGQG